MMYFKSYLKLSINVSKLWVALSFTPKLESLVDSNAWSLAHSVSRLAPKCQKIWKSLLSLKSYARTVVPSAKLWNSSAQVEGNIATLTVRLETVGAGLLISVEQLKKKNLFCHWEISRIVFQFLMHLHYESWGVKLCQMSGACAPSVSVQLTVGVRVRCLGVRLYRII